jgi:hypothetical protein
LSLGRPERQPPDELPSGFGPPAGFTLPGGPKVPGTRGDVRTGGALALAVLAVVVALPAGLLALLFALQARAANEHGQVDVARDKVRLARGFGWAGVALGVAGWAALAAILWWRA